MTRKTLEKANKYVIQISYLNRFINTCRTCWKIIRLKHPKFKMVTAYGALQNEIEVDDELARRILALIEDYVRELENDLEKM
jgi:lactam utilization protein B